MAALRGLCEQYGTTVEGLIDKALDGTLDAVERLVVEECADPDAVRAGRLRKQLRDIAGRDDEWKTALLGAIRDLASTIERLRAPLEAIRDPRATKQGR